MSPLRWLPRALLAAAVALCTVAAVGTGTSERYDRLVVDSIVEQGGELVDRPAPSFTLESLDGTVHSLESLRGQTLFVNLWATWCPPCRREFPAMIELSRQMEGRPFRIVAIAVDDEEEALRNFLTEVGADESSILVLRDPDRTVSGDFGTELLPESYFVDADGIVVAKFENERVWTESAFHRIIERVIQRRWRRS
jgi:thiol-disulfide isomerase/thioredoxin